MKKIVDLTKYEKLIRHYHEDDIIFEEGDLGREMYIIARGNVEIRKKTDKAEKVLMTLKVGDIFGEMALIDNFPRSAAAVAIEDTALIVVDEKSFDGMVVQNPGFALKLIKILSKRLRNSNEQIYELVTKDRKKYILTGLVEYGKKEGQKTYKGLMVDVKSFTVWANKNLGYPEKDIEYILRFLTQQQTLTYASSSSRDIIVPKNVVEKYGNL
jgi:CRP-like cAMP-binding protein